MHAYMKETNGNISETEKLLTNSLFFFILFTIIFKRHPQAQVHTAKQNEKGTVYISFFLFMDASDWCAVCSVSCAMSG